MRLASAPATMPRQRLLALGDRQRHGAQPGAHGAKVGGDQQRTVLGVQSDAVAPHEPFVQQPGGPGVRTARSSP